MVTINIALTVPMNPPGSEPSITPAQAWSALVRKAHRPQDFIPVVSSFTILSETPTRVAGEVSFHPGVGHARVIRQVCTLHAPCRIDYDIEGGSSAVNTISEMPGGDLVLTFVFRWAHPGVEDGSYEEKRLREGHVEVGLPRVVGIPAC